MNDSSNIGAAVVLLLASSALLFWAGMPTSNTLMLLIAAGLATTGLAAGSLLMGVTGTKGRSV
jgi:hypothetical protein